MTTTPRTWASGETPTGATFNTEIRDQFNSIFDAWTPYTPTWTAANTNPTLGNGTLLARYIKVGRTVHLHAELISGSTTVYGVGSWSFTLPFLAAASVGSRVGQAHALSSSRFGGQTIVAPGASTFSPFFPASSATSALSFTSNSVPFTWAATNQLRMSLTYETAT